jgi:hypothetical protein
MSAAGALSEIHERRLLHASEGSNESITDRR